jgi:putative peptidoglycan lipid II flippase
VLATPIVSLIFERGRFAPSDTAATAAALAFYAPGLLGYSVVKLASPAFYALGNSRVPVAASAFSVGFNILASLLLVDVLGHRGLALSTAMAALLNGGVLLWLLSGRLGGLEGGRLVKAALKISAASMAMAVAAYSTERVLRAPFSSVTVVAQTIRVFTSIAAGIAVLAAAAYVLRIEEFQQLIRRLSTNPRT